MWKILIDGSEDSEIRITAYLMVMKCPDYPTIIKIKDLLSSEEVNQGKPFLNLDQIQHLIDYYFFLNLKWGRLSGLI